MGTLSTCPTNAVSQPFSHPRISRNEDRLYGGFGLVFNHVFSSNNSRSFARENIDVRVRRHDLWDDGRFVFFVLLLKISAIVENLVVRAILISHIRVVENVAARQKK